MPFKIFVADSSPSALKALHLAFQDSNYDLYTSEDGIEALEIIIQIDPDAIVLGLSLPRRDGYDIASFLKKEEQFKDKPLILLQDAFQEPDEEKLKSLKYDKLFKKPIDSEEVVSAIRKLVGEIKAPDTLPEEPNVKEVRENTTEGDSVNMDSGKELEEVVMEKVRQEILQMERELEKRIVARLKAEE